MATTAFATLAVQAPPAPAGTAVAAGDDSLTITAQSFNLAIGGRFDLTLALPSTFDTGSLGPDAALRISSHPMIDDRESFLQALDGDLGDEDDRVEIVLDPATADPSTFPATGALAVGVSTVTDFARDAPRPSAAGTSTTTTTTTTTTPPTSTTAPPVEVPDSALTFVETGVHPVTVELRVRRRVVAETVTFVRVVDPEADIGDMAVGLLLGQTVKPTVGTDGAVAVDDGDLDELEALADTLAAIDAVPVALGTPDVVVPRTVFVEPAMLEAVVDEDPERAAGLMGGLMRSDVVSTPALPLEPSAAAAAGQTDAYTRLLTQGEDTLLRLLPQTTVSRVVQIARPPFTTAAAQLQRNIGAKLMVMNWEQYERTEGGNGPFTDTSQLVKTALTDDNSMLTALLDPHITARIDAGGDDPLRTAIQIVADLLVTARGIDDDGGVVSRHGLVLGRSDAGVPDAALVSHLVTLLSTTEGVRLAPVASLASTVDPLLQPGGGGEVRITLPRQPFVDLGDRLALIDEISEEILAFTSMLPNDSPAVADWLRVLDTLPSTTVDNSDAAAMVDRLRAEFDVYRTAIEGPRPFTFTLTGRSSTLTFSLRNNLDVPLEVRVRLSSPKLTFPQGDQIVTLLPGADTEIDADARALSNGKSSVFLRVYTPASEIEVMPEVVLTARVTSLAGLGQLLTGALVLLLLAWWGRHFQQSRRKRISLGGLGRHPSTNGNGDHSGATPRPDASGVLRDGDDLAPDAASTLPPS